MGASENDCLYIHRSDQMIHNSKLKNFVLDIQERFIIRWLIYFKVAIVKACCSKIYQQIQLCFCSSETILNCVIKGSKIVNWVFMPQTDKTDWFLRMKYNLIIGHPGSIYLFWNFLSNKNKLQYKTFIKMLHSYIIERCIM